MGLDTISWFVKFLFSIFLTEAFRHAPARIIAPFNYFSVVFAAIISWIVWNTSIHWFTITGIVLVIIGAGLTTLLSREII